MDPLSAIASIVGIVGFGIQIAQILQQEIDAVQTAPERVEQIVIEIRATATGLTNLQEFLLQDTEASDDDRIFNDDGRLEIAHIVRRCNSVFRNVTVLVAKAGDGVLSAVDFFQRQVEEKHKDKKSTEDVKLEIELSNLEHIMWPWRLPKIQQYIADLDRLKLSLVLILSVANLAKTKKQKMVKDKLPESEKWKGSQAETLVQDEIFYQDRGLREAEKKYENLAVITSPVDRLAQRPTGTAQELIQNWPNLPSGRGIATITELLESGVILESFAFNPDHDSETIIEMPLSFKTIQDHALKDRRWGTRKPHNVWDTFARLPTYQQEMLLSFIAQRKRDLYDYDHDISSGSPHLLVLISLNVVRHRRQRILEALRRFIELDTRNGPRRSTLFIVTARVNEPHRNSPTPLIASNSPWTPRRPRSFDEGSSGGYRFSFDSSYTSSTPSNRRSRSRTRVRVGRSRSRSPTRTKRELVLAVASGVKAAYNNTRVRKVKAAYNDRKASGSQKTKDHAAVRLAETSDTEVSDSNSDPNANDRNRRRHEHTYFPPPPTQPAQTVEKDDDEPRIFRRVTTEYKDSQLIPPVPRRTTTFREDTNGSRQTGGERGLAALGLDSTVGKAQRPAPPATPLEMPGNRTEIRRFQRSSSPGIEIVRGALPRRDTDRYNQTSRIVPRRGSWFRNAPGRRSRSRFSESRRTRMSNRGETSMQLYRKSPVRPMIRPISDDGVPPTQRDKAAVADFYLNKWTTAYDTVRASNRLRRRSKSRSRPRARSGYAPQAGDEGLIEYGEQPVYNNMTATDDYYAPPSNQRGYYADSNPYSPYNPADYSGYSSNDSIGAAGAPGYEARKEKKREDRERDKRRASSSDSYDGRVKAANKSNPPVRPLNSGRRELTGPGYVVTMSDDEEVEKSHSSPNEPSTLSVPAPQGAYAESVPDISNDETDK